MVLAAGLEPATYRLQGGCSKPTELRQQTGEDNRRYPPLYRPYLATARTRTIRRQFGAIVIRAVFSFSPSSF